MTGVSDEQRECWGRNLVDPDDVSTYIAMIAYIAEARVAVPALLEENARLEDANARLGAALKEQMRRTDVLIEERDQLRAQVAELTARCDRVRQRIALERDDQYPDWDYISSLLELEAQG